MFWFVVVLGILVFAIPQVVPLTTWGKRMRAWEDSLKQQEVALKGVSSDLKQQEVALKGVSSDLKQQEVALKGVLASMGLSQADIVPLLPIHMPQIPNNINKARKYLTKMRENQARRAELFAQKPLVATVATLFGSDLSKDRNAQVQDRIAKYKQECLTLAHQNNWGMPQFGTVPVVCKVTDIIDGDTVRVFIPSTGENFKVRMVGYDCPETCHPSKSVGHYGLEATRSAERLLRQALSVTIRLDREQSRQGWVYDRYGRLTAHIMVDGWLLGEILLEGGCAEVLDVFPIERAVLDSYRSLEASAKASGVGMWKDLNEIQQRKNARYHSPKSTDLINEILGLDDEDRQIVGLIKTEVRLTLSDLIGNLVVKSPHSTIVHSPECRYVTTMGHKQNVEVTEDSLKNMVPCKVCGGDPLVRESL